MIAWLLVAVFLAASFDAATNALWRWRIAETRRDVRAALLHACSAAGAFYLAWTVGAR